MVGPDGEPLFLAATKPVPPPRQCSPSPPHNRKPNRKLQSTASSPALLSSDHHAPRARTVSFLHCDAGSDVGSFKADYLGSKDIDSYTKSVNSVAKQLVNSKAVEVVAHVSSEKVRLAPPGSKTLLFKSFAVRDILSVEICSKNKRIVGVVVWKRGQLPVSHVLRCPTALLSTGLYEALLYQTQQVDDVSGSVSFYRWLCEYVKPGLQYDAGVFGSVSFFLPVRYDAGACVGCLLRTNRTLCLVLYCEPGLLHL